VGVVVLAGRVAGLLLGFTDFPTARVEAADRPDLVGEQVVRVGGAPTGAARCQRHRAQRHRPSEHACPPFAPGRLPRLGGKREMRFGPPRLASRSYNRAPFMKRLLVLTLAVMASACATVTLPPLARPKALDPAVAEVFYGAHIP